MGFESPLLLLSLLVLLPLGWLVRLAARQEAYLFRRWLAGTGVRDSLARWRWRLRLAALLLFGLCLGQPFLRLSRSPQQAQGHQVYFLLDLSASMGVRDVQPSRLGQAKRAIRYLSRRLAGEQTGLILFTSYPYVQCPLTRDGNAFRTMLELATPTQFANHGTNFRAALRALALRFESAPQTRDLPTSRVAVVLSDGGNFVSNYRSIENRLKRQGLQVYALSVGTEGGGVVPHPTDTSVSYLTNAEGNPIHSRVQPAALQKMANSFGTQLISLAGDNRQALNQLAERIRALPAARLSATEQEQEKVPLYPPLLLAGIGMLLLSMMFLPRQPPPSPPADPEP